MRPPRLLLSGYFGLDNLGDEALFESQVAALRAENPDVRLTALVARTERAEKLNVETVPRMKLGPIAAAMRKCDAFLSGGGGLIQDSTGPKSVIYYLGLLQLARWLGKPTFIYAQGFGPVRTPLGQRLCRWMLPSVSLATWRDQQSLDDFQRAGGGRVPSFVTADPALLLPPCPPKELALLLTRNGLSGEISRLEGPTGAHPGATPLVAVTVRPWPGFKLEEVAAALNDFPARYVLLAFHPEQDLEVCRELHKQLTQPATLIEEEWQPAEVAGFLRCCDMIVGMRLHSLILAAGAHVPCVGLSYDPKVQRFAHRAGALSLTLEELSRDSLKRALTHLLQARAHARQSAQGRVESMEQAARTTARAALALAAQGLPAALEILQ